MKTVLRLCCCLSIVLSSFGFTFEITPIPSTKYTGDLPVLLEKGVIRVLVSADLGFYYLDQGKPRGLTSELLELFEAYIAEATGQKYRLQIIPIDRDQLFPSLIAGVGDIAAANLTITPQRLQKVDFSDPFLTEVSELFVTEKKRRRITRLRQLSEKSVWVRASSSYYQSIRKINEQLAKKHLEPMYVHFLEETLEDYELVQMIQEGLIQMTVLDSHKAEFWSLVTGNLRLHTRYPIREHGSIGWAFRKNSPKLSKLINSFIEKNRRGTLNGNVIFNRYLNSKEWFKQVISPSSIKQFKNLQDKFIRYGNMYDINWLIIAAQAYQESQFDQSKRSHAGAIGIMQVLPQTANEPYINIRHIQNIENNIHAGVKYMDYIRNNYFQDEETDELNQLYFTLASYNAGPNRINRLRGVAKEQGYDPTKWFNNVEKVVKEEVGMEPVTYVGNINRYFTIYKQLMSMQTAAQSETARVHRLHYKLSR
ncbi:transglycosylase SLT domain-containing protein [Photobacterium ganghwense]|uniref:transglycosylase SLT domain-containing protein n=1 Tax=Photobacterium TaxID=657 RepID=UPI00235F25A8|nr:lytic transglycosylase F [Photobacterium sp. GSS17]